MKMRNSVVSPGPAALILTIVLGLAIPLLAGPPLICRSIDIGSAQSLPWSNPPDLTGLKDYNVAHLTGDTLALLNSSAPVLARMETLRRATIYAQRDPVASEELFSKLQERASANPREALAAFDLGYLAACYKQMREARSSGMTVWGRGDSVNPAADVDGYAEVKKAIGLRGEDPEMEFAAAIITAEHDSQGRHQEHLQKALAGAKGDPLLAENIASRFLKTAASKN
jgi:hypothetical protein